MNAVCFRFKASPQPQQDALSVATETRKDEMSKIVFDEVQASVYDITKSNSHYVFTEGSLIDVRDTVPALFQSEEQSGNRIDINGAIWSAPAAYSVYVLGSNTDVRIGVHGATHSVVVLGEDSSVSNAGTVIGSDFAVGTISADIENQGVLSGLSYGAITATGTIVNDAHALIRGNSGILLEEVEGVDAHALVINHGTIKGQDFGIHADSGRNVIHNDGTIWGGILLDDGNDVIDNRDGRVIGDVDGGDGNDLYRVSDRVTHLVENADAGVDLVQSTVSYRLADNFENLTLLGRERANGTGNSGSNLLVGNGGNNVLSGGGGSDLLNGSGGNDRLVGGEDDDVFVFAKHNGHDVIADFEDGSDHLFLSQVRNDADLHALKHDHLTVHGDNLVIRYGADTVTLEHMTAAELGTSDFIDDLGSL
jgi:Ca2+-binding RTX toxin-like protein